MSDKHEASAELEAERPLFARMMGAIHVKHTRGNRVGFVKLPLIMLDIKLYGGAIAQFYMVTEALEAQLAYGYEPALGGFYRPTPANYRPSRDELCMLGERPRRITPESLTVM